MRRVRDGERRIGAGVAAARRAALPAGAPRAWDEVRVADVLIVGTGVAGLAAALGCAGRRVTVLTKSRFGEGGSSAWAQGGVAVAVGADDSPALHAADTLAVAAGLADRRMVELLTAEGPGRIAELVRLGAGFDRKGAVEEAPQAPDHSAAAGDPAGRGEPRRRTPSGEGEGPTAGLALGREAAHCRRRILHAGGDATGRELVRALAAAVRRAPGVRVEEESFAVDLVVEPAARAPRRVAGVLALDRDGRRVLHLAAATVLATGGAGQLFLHTTNPPEVTADGLAMAARAGARLADLEFVQFHPTALAVAGPGGAARLPLLTEALRGEGAVLVDGRGRRFMPGEHPDAELAPRDVVARAIHRRLSAGEGVFLDARRAIGDRFPERFPTVFQAAREAGLDPRTEPLPVVPAAHYHMGGVVADERGRTSLPGLWACGETATTGVHGANRLASNSLLEGLVFGARVADDLARRLAAVPGATAADLARLRVAGEGAMGNVRSGEALETMPGSTLDLERRPAAPAVGGRTARTARQEESGGAFPGAGAPIRRWDASLPGFAAELHGASGDLADGADGSLEVDPEPPAGELSPAAFGASFGADLAPRAAELRHRLRARMAADVGLVRDAAGLARAADELRRLEGEVAELLREAAALSGSAAAGGVLRDLLETRNLLTAGALITAAARVRRESRGAHYRTDFPREDAGWRRRVLVTARPGAAPLLMLSAPIGESDAAESAAVASSFVPGGAGAAIAAGPPFGRTERADAGACPAAPDGPSIAYPAAAGGDLPAIATAGLPPRRSADSQPPLAGGLR